MHKSEKSSIQHLLLKQTADSHQCTTVIKIQTAPKIKSPNTFSPQCFYLSRNIKQYCGVFTTYTMYSHNTPYSYKERETEQKHFFTYCILDMKNKEPRTTLKFKEECSCQLCRFIFFLSFLFFCFVLFFCCLFVCFVFVWARVQVFPKFGECSFN